MTSRLEELRARFAAHKAALGRHDPLAFSRLVGFEPDPWQAAMLQDDARRLLVCCTRQAGKSTAASVLVAFRAVTQPNHLALLVSPSLRQSGEIFRKVNAVLRRVPDCPARTENNALSVTLSNGSRVVSLPSGADTVRGYSAVDTLIEDEAAFVDDKLNAAVRPMLAVSGGQLILMSSPNGRHGHFFEAWERGGDAWKRHTVTAWNVPRISREFLEAERAAIGPIRFAQEYECKFIAAATGAVYRVDRAKNVVNERPTNGTWTYLLGIDYGFTDETAFAVVGWRENDPAVYVVETWKTKGLTPSAAAEVVYELEKQYEFVRIVGDTGGLGKGYAEEARRRFGLPIEAALKQNKRGYIDLLNDALASERLRVVEGTCGALLDEWRDLCWDERREREMPGLPNHCSDAVLYAWRACSAYHEHAVDPAPAPGSPEALAAEERRIEDELDEEMADEEIRESDRRRGRFWR